MISLGINANYAPENKQLINLKRFLKDLKAPQTTRAYYLVSKPELLAKLSLTVCYTACQNEFSIF